MHIGVFGASYVDLVILQKPNYSKIVYIIDAFFNSLNYKTIVGTKKDCIFVDSHRGIEQ